MKTVAFFDVVAALGFAIFLAIIALTMVEISGSLEKIQKSQEKIEGYQQIMASPPK